VTTLYKPTGGGEGSLGWVDSTSFLAWTWDIHYGNHLIRAFNVETKKEVMWVKECFRAAAYAPSAGVLVFSISDTQEVWCQNDLGPGLYRVSKTDLSPVQIANVVPNLLEWSPEAGAFFGLALPPQPRKPRYLIRITPDGKVSEPIGNMEDLPVVSPDGKLWAWIDAGNDLNVADPEKATPVKIAESVGRTIWAR
jgi:hypothetical protein